MHRFLLLPDREREKETGASFSLSPSSSSVQEAGVRKKEKAKELFWDEGKRGKRGKGCDTAALCCLFPFSSVF